MDKLAIFGGKKTRTKDYPAWPVHDEHDAQAVANLVRTGNWGGFPYPGPETKKFVDSFIELQNGQYGVTMMNGTITMEIALRAANVGWGDEVIIPAYTFQATATAPMAAGAIPVMVDIDPDTFCIDPKAIEAAITEKTRAIIPVHIGSQMADMEAIMQIADKHNLIVVEDSAHAHGAMWDGRGAGTFGHFGSFSMQSTKSMSSGEGGLLLCRSEDLAYRIMSIIDCGRPHDPAGEIYTLGGNYRMSEMQSALLNVAMERFPDQFAEREAMADYMDEALSEVQGIRILKRHPKHEKRSIYKYIFAIDPEQFGATNQVIAKALMAEGIPCWQGYDPMYRYDLFQPQLSRLPVPSAFPEYFDFDKMHLPVTERISTQEGMWLDESIFRSGQGGVDDVVSALVKIQHWLSKDGSLAEQI